MRRGSQFRYAMKTVVVVATRNRHKVEELATMLEPRGFALRTLDEEAPHVQLTETGDTFAANAEEKALAVYRATGKATLADDSGLEVDALDGAPGVHSARYAAGADGHGHDDEANRQKLVAALAGKTTRTARFRCALAFVTTGGELVIAEGACEGTIIETPRGDGGFGYDPLFVPKGFDQTFAELASEQKNELSHRRRALDALVAKLDAKTDTDVQGEAPTE